VKLSSGVERILPEPWNHRVYTRTRRSLVYRNATCMPCRVLKANHGRHGRVRSTARWHRGERRRPEEWGRRWLAAGTGDMVAGRGPWSAPCRGPCCPRLPLASRSRINPRRDAPALLVRRSLADVSPGRRPPPGRELMNDGQRCQIL
jgi:hypothetical protein